MCHKFVLVSSLEVIEKKFHVTLNGYKRVLPINYAVSGGDYSYVITSEEPHELQTFKFGMTPYWAKSKMDLINARAEGDKNPTNDPSYSGPRQIFLKKAFLKPIQSQRCLVLADAYYDWSGAKKPYLVYLQDKQRPFAFAGLYDSWKDPETGVVTVSFSIITTTANSLLQTIGVKRMPVILPNGYEKDWIKDTLSLTQVLRMLNQFDPQKMNAYPISDKINLPDENSISLITPTGGKVQNEVQLAPKIGQYNKYNKHKFRHPPDGAWGENRKKL